MIILVKGLPASGKTWFSEKLSEKINAVHLNTDKIRLQLGLMGQYDDVSRKKTYDFLFMQLKNLLKQGKKVIVDGTFHEKETQDKILNLSKNQNTPLFVIELKADEDLIKKWMKGKRKYSEADFEVYRKLKEKDHPMKYKTLKLNSTDRNMKYLLSETMEYLKN
jgi:predicted kinase